MWNLIEIEGVNVLSFKKVKYTLPQGVTTLVYGINNDSVNGNSNGSGKSSLLEIAAIATTGKPLRKCKADEVVNDESESATFSVTYYNKVLDEKMIITRQIFRKSSSIVDVLIYRGGAKVDDNEFVLSGVDEYNKFIMDKLGITREEFLNNFVLSKYQYENFLSVSDKEKKEIINRFSNGVLIDQAIEKLLEDTLPVKEKLSEVQNKVVSIEGKILAVREQIEDEHLSIEAKKESSINKIDAYKKTLAEYRAKIREIGDGSQYIKEESLYSSLLDDLYSLDEATRESSAEDVISKIEQFCDDNKLNKDDFKSNLEAISKKLKQSSSLCKEKKAIHDKAVIELRGLELELTAMTDRSMLDIEGSSEQIVKRNCAIKEIGIKIRATSDQLDYQNTLINSCKNSIIKLSNIMDGAIKCPKCSYEFVLDNNDSVDVIGAKISEHKASIEKSKEEADKYTKLLLDLKGKKDTTLDEIDIIEDKSLAITRELTKMRAVVLETAKRVDALSKEVQALIKDTDESEKVVNDFINSCIDSVEEDINKRIEAAKKAAKADVEELARLELSIQSVLSSIESLESFDYNEGMKSLKERVDKYESDLRMADKDKVNCQLECDRYTAQEVLFNEYKTHLANTKINALSEVTNSFLEEIGSELRVKFNGYTMLKSGKVRDKISIELLRDGMEVGSFGKLSVGEAARINLACILAMNKLINVNCDQNKGLNLLILDEICDGVDNEGLMSMIEALNRIGITSMFISHGQIAENYEYFIKIVKENGESTIL